MNLISPPLDSSATLQDLLSKEEAEALERKGDEPLTPENARQVLTGCYLTFSHRYKSAPLCVLDFRKLKPERV